MLHALLKPGEMFAPCKQPDDMRIEGSPQWAIKFACGFLISSLVFSGFYVAEWEEWTGRKVVVIFEV